jgi:hypothetical protein
MYKPPISEFHDIEKSFNAKFDNNFDSRIPLIICEQKKSISDMSRTQLKQSASPEEKRTWRSNKKVGN